MIRQRAFAWLILFLLTSCASFSVPTSPQDAINEARILVTATARGITESVNNDIITKAEAQARLDRLKTYRTNLNEAQRLLDQGLDALAMDKVKLVNSLTLALRRDLARRAQP